MSPLVRSKLRALLLIVVVGETGDVLGRTA